MNHNFKNLIYNLIIFIFGTYTLYLYAMKKLPLFIHPRYISLTLVASIICIAISGIGIGFYSYLLIKSKEKKLINKFEPKLVLSFTPLILIILLFLTISPKPLSAATAEQRSVDLNAITKSKDSNQKTIFDNFVTDTTSYSIGDWVGLINTQTDLQYFQDKEVKISGFVLKDENNSNLYKIGRFMVTCCAVDARPVGIYVKETGENLANDEWIEIEGKFNIENINNKSEIVIIPSKINKISVPEYPYLY